jgi:hypothetical protein
MSAQIIDLRADPAFATIKNYKAAVAAFNAYDGPEDSEQHEKLERAFHEAQDEFLCVVPTTPEGFRAKVTVYLDVYCGGFYENFKPLLDTLCESACLIAAGQS